MAPACRQAGNGRCSIRDMYYVYVLQLRDSTFYKGQTEDLDQRLNQHSFGQVSSTKSKLPFKLLYVEVCDSREKARNLEKYFKSGFGREIIQELVGMAEW